MRVACEGSVAGLDPGGVGVAHPAFRPKFYINTPPFDLVLLFTVGAIYKNQPPFLKLRI